MKYNVEKNSNKNGFKIAGKTKITGLVIVMAMLVTQSVAGNDFSIPNILESSVENPENPEILEELQENDNSKTYEFENFELSTEASYTTVDAVLSNEWNGVKISEDVRYFTNSKDRYKKDVIVTYTISEAERDLENVEFVINMPNIYYNKETKTMELAENLDSLDGFSEIGIGAYNINAEGFELFLEEQEIAILLEKEEVSSVLANSLNSRNVDEEDEYLFTMLNSTGEKTKEVLRSEETELVEYDMVSQQIEEVLAEINAENELQTEIVTKNVRVIPGDSLLVEIQEEVPIETATPHELLKGKVVLKRDQIKAGEVVEISVRYETYGFIPADFKLDIEVELLCDGDEIEVFALNEEAIVDNGVEEFFEDNYNFGGDFSPEMNYETEENIFPEIDENEVFEDENSENENSEDEVSKDEDENSEDEVSKDENENLEDENLEDENSKDENSKDEVSKDENENSEDENSKDEDENSEDENSKDENENSEDEVSKDEVSKDEDENSEDEKQGFDMGDLDQVLAVRTEFDASKILLQNTIQIPINKNYTASAMSFVIPTDTALGDFLNDKADEYKDEIGDLEDFLSDKADEYEDEIEDLEDFLSDKADEIGDLEDFLSDKADEYKDEIGDLEDFLSDKADEYKDEIEDLEDFLSDKADELKNELLENSTDIKDYINQNVDSKFEDYGNYISLKQRNSVKSSVTIEFMASNPLNFKK